MARTLPLGIDIGASRLRIVCTQAAGRAQHVMSVAVRNLAPNIFAPDAAGEDDALGAVLADAWKELGTRERRCVLAVGVPEAHLHCVTFQKAAARDRTARLEAQKRVDYPVENAVVRVHPIDCRSGRYALGIVHAAALRARLAAVAASPLRAIAVDHESLALRRALPDYGAIVDIGLERSSLHAFAGAVPITLRIPLGGDTITREIERDLSIDARSAENRKRTHGVQGAGEAARDRLIAAVVARLDALDPRGCRLVRIALVGNGARLRELGADLERLSGRRVDLPAAAALCGEIYPPDVIAGAAPDWNLAVGLSLWAAAA